MKNFGSVYVYDNKDICIANLFHISKCRIRVKMWSSVCFIFVTDSMNHTPSRLSCSTVNLDTYFRHLAVAWVNRKLIRLFVVIFVTNVTKAHFLAFIAF